MIIYYQDKQIIVCEKPAGILSQPGEASLPGEDMISLLTGECGGEIHPVHRLDRGVGGIMVYARSAQAAAALDRAIAGREFTKEYLCVCHGRPDQPSGEMRDLLFHDQVRGKTFPADRIRRGVKEALLDYRLLDSAGEFSLVRVRLHTGRTHQIRAQFSFRHLPLAGDGKYGAKDHFRQIALHSCRIAFAHPAKGRPPVDLTSLPDFSTEPWAAFAQTEIKEMES